MLCALMEAAFTSGGPPFRLVLDRWDSDTIVAVMAVIGVAVGILIQNHDRGAKMVNDMTQSQAGLQKQIDDLEHRLTDLYAENQRVKATVADQQSELSRQRKRDARQQQEVDEDTKYIRSIAHWLREACEVMNIPDEWTAQHPKPRLPDSIRSRIVTSDGGEKK